jgi:hypothetical protein
MALIASGVSLFWVCGHQKQHELGAAMACVLGAGGAALGREPGSRDPYQPLVELPYTFNAHTDVILAANQKIAGKLASIFEKGGNKQTRSD